MDLPNMRIEDLPPELPFRVVEYYPPTWSHGHNHFAALDENPEDIADGLAQAVLDCSQDKHNGHGQHHSGSDAQAAYFEAIAQLLHNEDRKAYQELLTKIAHYRLWGVPPPELVLTPSSRNPAEWDAIVKHPVTGMPQFYKTRTNDIDMPDPRELGMRRNPAGPGWVRDDPQRSS